jgi:hypothetical protein
MIIRVTNPSIVVGAVVENDTVVRAAPILRGIIGLPAADALERLALIGEIELLTEPTDPPTQTEDR